MLPLAEELVNEAAPEVVKETAGAESAESVKDAAPPTEGAKRGEAGKSDESDKSDEDSMASSAERMTILRMIEQGKISAEDGARLLSALGDRQETENTPRPNVFDTSRYLQVRVSDLGTNRQKVNVTVPVGLLQLAWRWLPSSAKAQLDQVQAALDAGASGRLVEVVDQDSGVRVEISVV